MKKDEGNALLDRSRRLGRREVCQYLGAVGLGGAALLSLEPRSAYAKSASPDRKVAVPGLETVEYVDGYEIGAGISTLDGSARNTALTWDDTIKNLPSGSQTDTFINLVTTQKDFYSALGISTEVTASYGLGSVSAKMNFTKEFTSSSFSSWLVIRVSISRFKRMLPLNGIQMKPEVLAVLGGDNGAARFFQVYGDRFVYGIESGAEFLAVMQIDSTSEASKEKLQADWSASGQGAGLSGSTSGSIDNTINQSAATNKKEFICKTIGPGGLPASLDTDTVINFALAFPVTANPENSVPINAFLQDYHFFVLPAGMKLSWPDLENAKRVTATINGYLQILHTQLAIAQDIASNAERYELKLIAQIRKTYSDIVTQIQADITSLNKIEEATVTSFTSQDAPEVPPLPSIPLYVQNPVPQPGNVVAYYHIVNSKSQQVIGVGGASTDSGAQLVQWPANGNTDQDWMLETTDGTYYHIRDKNSGQLVGVGGASTDSGAQLVQWPANGSTDQDWMLDPVFTS